MMRIVLLKLNGQMRMKLMYLCLLLVRRQTPISPEASARFCMSSKQTRASAPYINRDRQKSYLNSRFAAEYLQIPVGVCSLVCACTLVCVCVSEKQGLSPLCAIQRVRLCKVETEITCRRVNKINNIRPYSLLNQITRYRPFL